MESVARATRVGWLVVAVLACAFSYSLGFQFGYCDGTTKADDRYGRVNESLRSMMQAGDEAEVARQREVTARLPSGPASVSTF